jgi:predicted HD superfamily hydrolase involved in NAD metabolism
MFDPISSIKHRTTLSNIQNFLRPNLSPKRYRHILRVCNTGLHLASRLGADEKKVELACLLHDIAREWPEESLVKKAQAVGEEVSVEELARPILLHGRVAAILAQEKFSVYDPEILEALRYHTLGKAGMQQTGRILYVADYLEPGRSYTTEGFRQKVASVSLPEMILAIHEHAKRRGKGFTQSGEEMEAEALKEYQSAVRIKILNR